MNNIRNRISKFFGSYRIENESDDQRAIRSIVESSLIDLNVSVRVVPIKNSEHVDYLLIDEHNQVYISIDDNKIGISNHDYYYNDYFNTDFTNQMKKLVRDNLEEERLKLKESLFQNKLGLLHKIEKIYKK